MEKKKNLPAVVWWMRRQTMKVKVLLVVSLMVACLVALKLTVKNHAYFFVASELSHAVGLLVLGYKLIRQRTCSENPLKSLRDWWFNLQDNSREQEPLKESRDRLLVVATLIASPSRLESGPPGGVGLESSDGHFPGQAIYASQAGPFYVFLVCNTLVLSLSINLIISLTCGMQFFLEVMLAAGSMAVTYGSAIYAVTPKSPDQFRWLLFTGFVPYFLRLLIQMGKCCNPMRK